MTSDQRQRNPGHDSTRRASLSEAGHALKTKVPSVLAIGLESFSFRDGGLNRYFSQLIAALGELGVPIVGIALATGKLETCRTSWKSFPHRRHHSRLGSGLCVRPPIGTPMPTSLTPTSPCRLSPCFLVASSPAARGAFSWPVGRRECPGRPRAAEMRIEAPARASRLPPSRCVCCPLTRLPARLGRALRREPVGYPRCSARWTQRFSRRATDPRRGQRWAFRMTPLLPSPSAGSCLGWESMSSLRPG